MTSWQYTLAMASDSRTSASSCRTVMRYADCVPGAASSLRSSLYMRTSFSAASWDSCGLMERAYRMYLQGGGADACV